MVAILDADFMSDLRYFVVIVIGRVHLHNTSHKVEKGMNFGYYAQTVALEVW